jgi:putative tryptophan/tyrosine transport system substrate-binding protein
VASAESRKVSSATLVIDYRSAEGRPDRFRVLAAELVNLKVDLITTRGTPAALAAKSATRTIPVVMAAMLVLIPHSSTTDWRRA